VKEFIPEPHPPKRIRRPHAILASSAPYRRAQIWPGRGTATRPQDNGPGRKSGLIEGDSADKLPNPYDSMAPENQEWAKMSSAAQPARSSRTRSGRKRKQAAASS